MTKQPAKKAKPKTQEIPEPKNVHEAINHVMGRVGYVQKQDAKGLPYTFAGEAAFIKAVRPHLVDVGLVVYQSNVELLGRFEFTSKGGAPGINILAKFTWTWVHTTSGTSIEVTTIGEAADYGDKAANKAMTAGMKYNMRQTLVIETGDDPDTTSSDEFLRAQKREAEEGKSGKKTAKKQKPDESGKTVVRVKNQWEGDVIKTIMDLGLARASEHVVNRLNPSIFMTTVSYGELTEQDAVAYMLAWDDAQEKYPDEDTQERAKRVDNNYIEFTGQAIELLSVGAA